MSVIEMLPSPLREKINILPDPEKFVIQTLEDALDKYKELPETRSIRGKYKFLPTSSEAFSLKKRDELKLER